MTCPVDLKPNIEQFSDDPDEFWDEFVAENPTPAGMTSDAEIVWLKDRFAKRYAHCFAKILGPFHPYDAYDLPKDVKARIKNYILVANAP